MPSRFRRFAWIKKPALNSSFGPIHMERSKSIGITIPMKWPNPSQSISARFGVTKTMFCGGQVLPPTLKDYFGPSFTFGKGRVQPTADDPKALKIRVLSAFEEASIFLSHSTSVFLTFSKQGWNW